MSSGVSFYFKINSILTDEFLPEKNQDQTQCIISEETSDNTGVHLKTCQQKSLLWEYRLVSGFVPQCVTVSQSIRHWYIWYYSQMAAKKKPK